MIKNNYQLKEHSQLLAVSLSSDDIEILLSKFVGKLDVTANINLHGKYNLESHQYVGVIFLAESKIIVEPKTNIVNLTYMLSSVYNLIGWEKSFGECSTITEWSNLVVKLFLDLLQQLVSKGLNQNYQEVNQNSTLIKGQIDFSTQFTENFANPIQHNCNYSELSVNTLENQLLKLALTKLYQLHQQSEIAWQISQLQRYFSSVNLPININLSYSKITFSRLNEHYKLPLSLAQMILEESGPLLEGNTHLFPAFLIDMNKLFERYVADRLKTYCQENHSHLLHKITIHYQTQYYLDNFSEIKIIPDLILSKADEVLAVMDVKYKTQGNSINHDYYQIITYCLVNNTSKGFLIYPTWEQQSKKFYIKNSKIVIECVGVILDKGIKELNTSIDRLVDISIN